MDPIKHIVGHLNGLFKSAFSDLSRVQILGLCQLVSRTYKDNSPTTWPATSDYENMQYAGIDEDYELIIYHRSLGLAVSYATNSGYGDNKPDTVNNQRMCMVLFANKKNVKMTREEMSMQIQALMPDQLVKEERPDNIKIVNIKISDLVLDETQVFGEEYKNVDYFLGPEHILIKVNYTIESTFDKRCFITNRQTAQNC